MSLRRTDPAILILLAIGALGTAVAVSHWVASPTGLVFGAIAFVLVTCGVLAANWNEGARVSSRLLVIAAAVVVTAFFWLLFSDTSQVPIPRGRYIGLLSAAAVFASLLFIRSSPRNRWAIAGLLLSYVALGTWTIVRTPSPPIDVWAWHKEALDALFAGHNPYAITMPNIYGEASKVYYGAGLVAGDRVLVGFQYPPLSLFLAVPGYLVGDYRYSLLIAGALTGALLYVSRPDRIGAIALMLWCFSPVSFFVIEFGWTDRFVVLFLTMTAFAASRGSRWTFIPLGLFFGVKQYAILAAPLVLLLPIPAGDDSTTGRVKLLLKAVAVAAAVTVPMFLLDPSAMIRDLITFQVLQPFRAESLSFPGWWSQSMHGGELPGWLCFAAFVPATLLVLWRRRVTDFGFPLGTAFVLLVFFAFGKQAFVNYYQFIFGALVTAFVFMAEKRDG